MDRTSDITLLGFDPICFRFVRMKRRQGLKAVADAAGVGRSVVMALEAGRSVRRDQLRNLRAVLKP